MATATPFETQGPIDPHSPPELSPTTSRSSGPGILEVIPGPVVEESAIPDGGLRAWLVVFGGFLNFTTSFGLMNSFGVFQTFYARNLLSNEDRSTVAWIGGVQLFMMFIGGLVCGPLFDRWGARRIMIPGAAICLLSYITASFSDQFYQLLIAQGFLFGIRNAMLYHPTAGAIAEWFDEHRGLALGLAVSGSSIGGILWPFVIGKLLPTVRFAWTYRVLAFASLPVLIIACCLVQERQNARGRNIHGYKLQSPPSVFREIFQRQYLVLCASLFFVLIGMLIPFNYIGSYAVDHNLDASMGGRLLSICYVGSVVGRISTGWAADRLGRFNVLIAMSFATSTLIFSWTKMTSLAGQIAFAVLYGLFAGGLVPLGSACVAQTTTDMGHLGLRIGVMIALCSPGALTANTIGGELFKTSLRWNAVHAFAGSAVLFGAVGLLFEVDPVSGTFQGLDMLVVPLQPYFQESWGLIEEHTAPNSPPFEPNSFSAIPTPDRYGRNGLRSNDAALRRSSGSDPPTAR
ncbi:major facilitator superfamily domain-containing protein [Dactylonectria macrodidyma]|uniref:Major facilitator superfamily domain-containing protein n=1 Tax=Dactylonectria macrodidyma TaxID=307937 RepID=A0A9P9J803_9HYPO|nr:major facilitator superfamily domain-containing protein [Dactylonectria macrodidyma]